MNKQEVYTIGRILQLSRYDIDQLAKCKTTLWKSNQSPQYCSTYKAGTHYGTVSLKDF